MFLRNNLLIHFPHVVFDWQVFVLLSVVFFSVSPVSSSTFCHSVGVKRRDFMKGRAKREWFTYPPERWWENATFSAPGVRRSGVGIFQLRCLSDDRKLPLLTPLQRRLHPTFSLTFWKRHSQPSHPLHTAIGQMCGAEKGGGVWFPLSLQNFFSSLHTTTSATSRVNSRVQHHERLPAETVQKARCRR